MISALYYAAASTTAIAGILHLMLGPNSLEFNINNGVFFIVENLYRMLNTYTARDARRKENTKLHISTGF
jgi:uncharacterized membrane protein